MRKYLALIKTVFQDEFEYPAGIIYWVVLDLIPLIIMFYLWLVVYKTNTKIGDLNLNSMITYYFLMFIIFRLHAHSAFWLADLIKKGDIVGILLKPFSFLSYVIYRTFTRKWISLVISLPVIILAIIFLKDFIIFPKSIPHLIAFLISLLLSMAIFILIGVILGLVSFWTMEIGGLYYFCYNIMGFLGGLYLPLSLFPEKLAKVLNFLPFYYLYYFPANIYLNQVSFDKIVMGFGISSLWLILLFFSYKIIWHFGIKQYESFGN
ncbi:ABC-2 family transporter protein [Candidatus Parcubacteria bacterium]|nr:ABC-2 family transporter protein [Patescibacteria group bacterium]MCG2688532.1 ABC-2 family transporter protein [Candidatus Parcubacteria bacterium]